MSDEHGKPVKPKLDYHLNKQERDILYCVVSTMEDMFHVKPAAMPEFFIKAAHDLTLLIKEQESCTCAGCEQRRNAAKSNWN